MVLIRKMRFCDNLILLRVGDNRIVRQRQLAIETTSGQRCLECSRESSGETADQTRLVGQMVRQHPDKEDTKTTTYKVGQPSDGRDIAKWWPRENWWRDSQPSANWETVTRDATDSHLRVGQEKTERRVRDGRADWEKIVRQSSEPRSDRTKTAESVAEQRRLNKGGWEMAELWLRDNQKHTRPTDNWPDKHDWKIVAGYRAAPNLSTTTRIEISDRRTTSQERPPQT